MRFLRKFLILWLSISVVFSPAYAQTTQSVGESFVIEDIRIDGLQRFSIGAITTRLPVDIGDTFTAAVSSEIIKKLFDTGYFRSVDIFREGNVLVVSLQENPTIAEVTASGNEELQEEVLQGLLSNAGIVEAGVFNRGVLELATKAIEGFYVDRNFYHVKVEPVVSPLPRNRVAILLNITEGEEAYIRSIDIVDNNEFSDSRLLREMEMEPKGLLNYFSDNYKFSESRLETDVNRLRTHYLESGYLDFKVESRQAEISPDKKYIDIVIRVNEGDLYTVGSIDFVNADGSEVVEFDAAELVALLEQSVGDTYSGNLAQETIKGIRDYLGNQGYSSAVVQIETDLDADNNQVDVDFVLNTGVIIFVRKINIVGNEFTADETIRRELVQYENSQYSHDNVTASRSRVNRLGYFNSVQITEIAVPGSPKEVDLLVEVVEKDTGEISLGAGFSTDGGITYNAGFSTKNIFGTGNDFSIGVAVGEDSKKYDLSLDEYYHTQDGVSRHIKLQYEDKDADEDATDYSINRKRLEYGYGFPFTDNGSYRIKAAFERTTINDTQFVEPIYQDYLIEYGEELDHYLLLFDVTYDSRDASTAPTEGQRITFNSEWSIPGTGAGYYQYNYEHNLYHQLKIIPANPIMRYKLGYGYGDTYSLSDVFPFYKRLYVGGTNTVRGYDSNSIGFTTDFTGKAVGGQSRLYGSVESAFRTTYFKDQQIYLVPFIDSGIAGRDIDLAVLYASWGIELRWLSPVGPLRFSYALPVKEEREEDSVQNFQFSISSF